MACGNSVLAAIRDENAVARHSEAHWPGKLPVPCAFGTKRPHERAVQPVHRDATVAAIHDEELIARHR